MELDVNADGMIVWSFDFALSSFWEVETELVEKLLPPALPPMEVAPGVSLINLTAFNFPAGGLGSLPEFQELIFAAVVAPDLSRGVPKFAMHVLSLGSTCQDHLDHSADYYKLPSYKRTFDARIQHGELVANYSDRDGDILRMKNCSPELNFAPSGRYFQAFTHKDGQTYVADIHIRARLYEHQVAGDMGTLFDHPFLHEMGLEDADPVAYLQMITAPGETGKQYYPRPELFG